MSYSSIVQERVYRDYHLQLLEAFIVKIQQHQPFILDDCNEEDEEFLRAIKSLHQQRDSNPEFLHDGQRLLSRVVSTYPHLMPLLPRDLLWFFGGDCLHFMPDEEIKSYQMLDEGRHQAVCDEREFSYENERARIFGLH